MIMITLNTQRFMALCYGLCAFDYVVLFFKQSNSETCEVNTINVVYLLYVYNSLPTKTRIGNISSCYRKVQLFTLMDFPLIVDLSMDDYYICFVYYSSYIHVLLG